jgi:hypothetical protein
VSDHAWVIGVIGLAIVLMLLVFVSIDIAAGTSAGDLFRRYAKRVLDLIF